MADYAGVNWDRLMNSYQDQHTNNEITDYDAFSYFVKLRKLLEKKTVNFWHRKYLERYLEEEDIAPFGLRVQIFPQLGNLTPEFKSSWERILMECLSQMMKAIINEYNRLIEETDRELFVLFSAHLDISTATQYKEKDNELRDFLDKLID